MRGVPLKYSIRNLWRRPGRTFLTVMGLSLLVAVIVFLVAFGRSFARSLRISGDPQTLIVLSKKAQTFEFSALHPADLDAMEIDVEEYLEPYDESRSLFTREIFHYASVKLAADPAKLARQGLVLGIPCAMVPRLFPDFELTGGRLPRPDSNEILVGNNAADRLRAPPEWLAEKSKLEFRGREFTVVGTFKAPGSLYENWLLTDADDLRIALNRPDFSFARMKVKAGVDMDALAKRLNLDEQYEVRVLREEAYFADFAEGFSHFQEFAVLLAVALGIGGLLTGMNTLHNAVVGRIREIGTLRVLGFGRRKILVAFVVEALLLTGMAGVIGCGIGLLTDGLPLRVPMAATFPVVIDLPALAVGFGVALLMGLLGLAWPLYRALRMPAVEAVRAI